MEIILSLMFVVSPLLMALLSLGAIMGKPTRKRLYKVLRVHWTPKFKRKSLAPNIIPEGFAKLEPRNKDWGPDGKLTQMWTDAFEYWQLEDPQWTLECYRIKQHEWEQKRDELNHRIKVGDDIHARYVKGLGRGGVSINAAVDGKMDADQARRDLRWLEERGPVHLTSEERVVAGLAKRYGTEVFYNNDLVRLSAQKQMPTFDYIALTSV